MKDLITEQDLEVIFDEMLNDTHQAIRILGLDFDPSTILKECDPIAYQCYFNDWLDQEIENGFIIQEKDSYYLK